MADQSEFVRGKNVVAVIAFHETSIYPTDAAPGERPERLVARDPLGHFEKVRHHAGNPRGIYEGDSSEYWQRITESLAPAGAILLVGHGKGHADATHDWLAYAEKHRQDVAAKVVADIRADLDHLDDKQILRLAQQYFGDSPPRDFGDGRWGEPGFSA
jgi:hypothetical protein